MPQVSTGSTTNFLICIHLTVMIQSVTVISVHKKLVTQLFIKNSIFVYQSKAA